MFHPSRGGVRGGQDQFSWDNVKEDKYRENYLGHSLKAPVGRWQKGKDLTWYAKDDKTKEKERKKEIQAIKDAEEEAMLEALGHPVKKKSAVDNQIDAKELQNVLQKGNREIEDGQGEYEIKGLGFRDSHSKSLTGKIESTKFTSISTNVQQNNTTTLSSLQQHEDGDNFGNPVKSHSKHKSKKKEKKSKFKHKHKEKKQKYKSDSESGDERHSRSRHVPSTRQPHKEYYSNRERNSCSPTRHDYKSNQDRKEHHNVNREYNSRRENSPVHRSRYSQRERLRRYSRSRSPVKTSRDPRRDRK